MKSDTSRTALKEETRRRILDSATELLRSGGMGAASVSEVMKGAGLTVGGFYAHFDSKDALVAETLRRTMREMFGVLVAGLEEADAATRFDEILKRYLSRSHRDHPTRGCVMPAMLGEIGHTEAACRGAFSAELDAIASKMGGREEHRQTALGALALMVGGITLARALSGTPLSDEVLVASRELGRAALKSKGLGRRGSKKEES